MTTERHVLLIDLVDDAEAIARYEAWHAAGAIPAEIRDSIRTAGIVAMDIFRSGNRLVMLMETDASFDPVRKAAADRGDPAVVAWETRMNTVQRPLSWAEPQAKWTTAHRIFSLDEQ